MNDEMSAMPFPVDFRKHHHDRIFKQVSFPGTEGTYRLRIVNAGGNPESTVVQKHANTGISLESVDGAIFRIKAVLDTPDSGVDESYWLTLHHTDYSEEVLPLNQYRVRGISDKGYRSDWIYSELRNDQNELLVYEMLYDLLDILDTVREGDIDMMLTLIAQDAYKSFQTKDRSRYDYLIDHGEEMRQGLAENAEMEVGGTLSTRESLDSVVVEVFSFIGKELGREFKEVFMASSKEFTELLKQYRFSDQLKSRVNEFVGMVFEVFLEDTLDRVIERANIEVLVENGENKQLYLEGTYDLDIKSELLRSAYNIMPTDDFVLKANGTVQLFIGPVLSEEVDYSYIESTKNDLSYFKNEILETIAAQPTEEVFLLMRLFVEEGFFPYLFADQAGVMTYTDLREDLSDMKMFSEGIVRYDLTADEDVSRYMIVNDVIEYLIKGEILPHADDYFIGILDQLIGRIHEKTKMLVDYGIMDIFDSFAEIGERLEHGYLAIKGVTSDEWTLEMNDLVTGTLRPSANAVDHLHLTAKDTQRISWDNERRLIERIELMFNENAHTGSDLQQNYHDEIQMDAGDMAYMTPCPHQSNQDEMQLSTQDTARVKGDLRSILSDYYDILISEQITSQEKRAQSIREGFRIAPVSRLSPTYLPHLRDRQKQMIQAIYDIQLYTGLQDHYRISGREKVQYAIGSGFDQGWPIGEFKLGVNTLKGVNS